MRVQANEWRAVRREQERKVYEVTVTGALDREIAEGFARAMRGSTAGNLPPSMRVVVREVAGEPEDDRYAIPVLFTVVATSEEQAADTLAVMLQRRLPDSGPIFEDWRTVNHPDADGSDDEDWRLLLRREV